MQINIVAFSLSFQVQYNNAGSYISIYYVMWCVDIEHKNMT